MHTSVNQPLNSRDMPQCKFHRKFAALCDGIEHYSILDGPSNGTEILLFFEDILSLENPDGSTVLERGDMVVMDNCRFRHGCFAEGMLRDLFEELGVQL